MDAMHHAGVSPVYHIMRNDRHDTHWWPDERAFYETFVHEHPRPAHPDRLSWETDRTWSSASAARSLIRCSASETGAGGSGRKWSINSS